MGDIDRKLQPREGQNVAIEGRMVAVKKATAPLRVRLTGGESFVLAQGDQIRPAGGFSEFRIENTSEEQSDITLVVTSGDFTRREIAQAVRVADSVPLRVNVAEQSLADRPYLRAGQTYAARIKTEPFVQQRTVYLFVPEDKSVNVVGPEFFMNVDAATDATIYRVKMNNGTLANGSLKGQNCDFSRYKSPSARFATYSENPNILDEVSGISELGYLTSNLYAPMQRFIIGNGGLLIPPGFAIAVTVKKGVGFEAPADGAQIETIFSWAWIEQPYDE